MSGTRALYSGLPLWMTKGYIVLFLTSSEGIMTWNKTTSRWVSHSLTKMVQYLSHNKTMAKWAARISLGLSNSIPGVMLNPDQIRQEADIGE